MSTRRALFFSFIDRYSGLVLSIISSMVIARLLKPEEIGVFSVAMAMLAFAGTLRDMGAGQYVVQAKEVNPDILRAVWTIQFSVGAALGLLVAALAYPMAVFYNEPRIVPIMGVMALTYLVTPVGSITYALLMREMRFQHVAVMRFTSGVVGAVVAIGLAYQGFGPVSLAWSLLAASITTALAAQFYRQPGQPWGFSFIGARNVLGFGGRITGTSFINTLVHGMPDFALGKLQGMAAAGLYSRSNGLVSMFNRLLLDAIYNVAVAHFAQGRRTVTDPVADFLRAMSSLITLNVVFAAMLVAFANPLTRTLYGDQWNDSIELTRWLALAALLLAPQPVCAAVMVGQGRADLLLKSTLATGAASIVAALIGAAYELWVLGALLVLAQFLSGITWCVIARQVCRYRYCELLKTSARAVLTGCVAVAPVLIVLAYFGVEPVNPLLSLVAGGLACLLGLPSALLLTRHPLGSEIKAALGRFAPRRAAT